MKPYQATLEQLHRHLEPLALSHLVDQHSLYPGQRRTQLVQALLSRLLGPKQLHDIRLKDTGAHDALAEDERFARRCQAILKILGITASPDQLRGCSGQQEQDTAPLIQMAKLLLVMEKQRTACSKAAPQQQQQQQQQQELEHYEVSADVATYINQVSQLLTVVSSQMPRLLSDQAHTFPSDMADTLQAYNDQGALVKLPQLCQHVDERLQQLQQTLDTLKKAGGSDCEGAGGLAWQQLVDEVDAAVSLLLQQMQVFDSVYQQELSVWAGGASEHNQQVLDAALSSHGAQATGQLARRLMTAYGELQLIMDAIKAIRTQHQALKDLPAAELQQQRDRHFTDTLKLRVASSAVRSTPC